MLGSFGRTLARTALCSLGIVFLGLFVAGCTNTFRQIALPLPTQTGDPAPLNRALFAATAGGSVAGSVTMVDVPGDTNVGVEQVGVNPVMIGLTFGGGRAVTANTADNTASSFLTGVTFGTVNTTSLPSGSGATFVHSRQPNKFYIALSAIDALGVVDSSLSLIKQVDLTPQGCSNPVAISQVPDGGNIYVGCKGSGNVVSVTPSDNVLISSSITVGSSPVWMDTSFDGKYTFVANQGSSSVSVICTTTDSTVCAGNTVIATTSLPGAPSYVKYDTHSGHVLVAGAGFVSVLDASGTTPTFAQVAGSPLTGATFSGNTWVTALKDGSRLYVSDSGSGTVSVFNMSNLQFLKTIDLTTVDPGTSPIMIDSDKNSTKVYTANVGSNDFSIINTTTDTEVLQSSVPQRLTPPALAGCLPAGPSCRQTPTFLVVLP